MKKTLAILLTALFLGLSVPSSSEACRKGAPAKNPSHVKGYTKKSGRAVRPHTRTRVKKYGKKARKSRASKSKQSRISRQGRRSK